MKNLRNIFHFGWPYLRRYWPRFVAGTLLGILFGLSNAAFVWVTKTTFERLSTQPVVTTNAAPITVQGGAFGEKFKGAEKRLEGSLDSWLPKMGRKLDWRQLVGGLLLLPVLVAFRGYVGYLSSYCLGWVSERVINDLRLDVLVKLNTLSLDFFNRSTMGDLLTRINTDTAALHRSLSLGCSDLIKEPVTIIAILISLCAIDWKLTVFAAIFLPVCVLPMRVLGKKIELAARGSRGATVSQSSLLVELLSSIRVIKAFNLETFQQDRFREISRDSVRHGMKSVQAREMINPLIETISMIGLAVLIIYIFQSNRSIPNVVSFLTGVALMFTPVKKLGQLHILTKQASVGVDRLIAVLNEQPTVKETATPKALGPFKSEIRIENLSFSYGNQMVLSDINLTIPRGQKLGIAGESGSGKSTLVNLLFRFHDPVKGAIKIDGTDLREVSMTELRRHMALVSQEIVIYDLSAAENIRLGNLTATREEIERAARAANAHEFISALPKGYDTRLGERGESLSGGQRQRIAIARAFIRNAPILALDEATASLDPQAEAEVQTAIDQIVGGHTVICVAHRFATLRTMDKIIVLANGRIVEEGTFDQLVQKRGAFAAMAARQGYT